MADPFVQPGTTPPILSQSGIRSTEVAPTALNRVLSERFGLNEFRPHQEVIIQAMLRGEHVFATLPTGYGKSLCFELPGVMSDRLTIVVSPLIALMRDQAARVAAAGNRVAAIHSALDRATIEREYARVRSGEVQFLYISPERLTTQSFYDGIQGSPVGRLVVDEAHCVSFWGHDFRSSYLKIPESYQRLGNPPVAAFTATASFNVRTEVLKHLQIEGAFQLHADVDRPNLTLTVEHCQNESDKLRRLVPHLRQHAEGRELVVVYCTRVTTVEEVSSELAALRLPHSIYHGQLESQQRERVEREFRTGAVPLLIATNAFGMGIDKSDIRAVYHFELPDSLEAYFQEIGRAGRDGKPAHAVLFECSYDSANLQRRIEMKNPPLSFIQRMHARAARWVPADRRSDPVPEGRFYRSAFCEGVGDGDPKLEGMANSALSILEEHGLIHLSGGMIRLNVKPEDVQDTFPISRQLLDAKHEADLQRLALMEYYARIVTDLRGALLSHFRSNGLVDEMTKVQPPLFALIPQQVFTLLAPLITSDKELGAFQDLMRLRAKGKAEEPAPLEGYTKGEVRLQLEYVASQGLLRFVPIQSSTFLALTATGIEFLKRAAVEVPEPKSYREGSRLMYSPRGREPFAAALRPWYEATRASCPDPSGWNTRLDLFFRTPFTVFGKSVTGAEITYDYLRRALPKGKQPRPSYMEANLLLNYLFQTADPVDGRETPQG